MSLIVAKVEGNSILIVSDTKLSYSNDGEEEAQRQKVKPNEGVIKTTIINSNVCVSFAGNVDEAEKAIKDIEPSNTIDQIQNILYKSHRDSLGEVDYIIALGLPIPKIIVIKNGKVEESLYSWIGNKDGYERFQKYMLGKVKSDRPETSFKVELSIEKKPDIFDNLINSMDRVIEDSDIKGIAGFRVSVIFEEGKFIYRPYLHSYSGTPTIEITMPPGVRSVTFPMPIHGSNASGGYTINFFRSKENTNNVGIHLLQGNLGIIYKREDNGLLKPTVYTNIDEIDFCEFTEVNFNISPMGITQSRERKYFDKANSHFENNQFKEAIEFYDKTLPLADSRLKAEVFYRKGVAYFNLRNLQDAMINFQSAININSDYQKIASQIMQRMYKW